MNKDSFHKLRDGFVEHLVAKVGWQISVPLILELKDQTNLVSWGSSWGSSRTVFTFDFLIWLQPLARVSEIICSDHLPGDNIEVWDDNGFLRSILIPAKDFLGCGDDR